jgi:hypothetical protein
MNNFAKEAKILEAQYTYINGKYTLNKVKAAHPMGAKAPPNINLSVIFKLTLQSLDMVPFVVPTPHSSSPIEAEDERRLVREDNLPPILDSPVQVVFTPLNPLFLVDFANHNLIRLPVRIKLSVRVYRPRDCAQAYVFSGNFFADLITSD